MTSEAISGFLEGSIKDASRCKYVGGFRISVDWFAVFIAVDDFEVD